MIRLGDEMDDIALENLRISDFLDKTASGSPVPGGGSAAALSASVAAGLIEMVANVSMGKTAGSEIEDTLKGIGKDAHNFRNRLMADIDRDANAYQQVLEAYRLPKCRGDEKSERDNAIQGALKHAALIPLGVAETAFRLMGLAETVALKGNKNARSDAAVAIMMARTAVLSALCNVKINLTSVKDEQFVKKVYEQIESLEAEAVNKEQEILSKI